LYVYGCGSNNNNKNTLAAIGGHSRRWCPAAVVDLPHDEDLPHPRPDDCPDGSPLLRHLENQDKYSDFYSLETKPFSKKKKKWQVIKSD
jgi:hypothetical protein